MKLEVVDLHSFAPELLTRGVVLDTGCRGFRFGMHFLSLGHPVVFMDPALDVIPPREIYDAATWASHLGCALVAPGYPKTMRLRMTSDPEARHITHAVHEGDPVVPCMTIQEVMTTLSIQQFDLVKLNVEGAEYDVLGQWPGPVARQIVVSFHEHTDRGRGDAAIQRIVEHLGEWYTPVRHEFDERYCAGRNAWDSVFVLKELV